MKTTLSRTIEHKVEIELTGTEIADLFWNLDENGQADFFNRLGGEGMLCFQLSAITKSNRLKGDGRHAMAIIGEYCQ